MKKKKAMHVYVAMTSHGVIITSTARNITKEFNRLKKDPDYGKVIDCYVTPKCINAREVWREVTMQKPYDLAGIVRTVKEQFNRMAILEMEDNE
jgi:hypothetical protein